MVAGIRLVPAAASGRGYRVGLTNWGIGKV